MHMANYQCFPHFLACYNLVFRSKLSRIDLLKFDAFLTQKDILIVLRVTYYH